MRIIVTGGGTGGHIYPAVSVANSLIDKGNNLLYIGSRGGLEGRIVPREGIPYREVSAYYLPRKISFKLILSIFKTSLGFIESRRIIKDFNPDVVLGTGGFAAGPVVLAASLMGIPTIIHEQNVYPGFTNRLLSYFSRKIALNFEDAVNYFPEKTKNKTVVTGNPIRRSILTTTREQGLKKLNLKAGKKTLLVFGGSQGSLSINRAMVEVYKNFKDASWLQVIHITGDKNYKLLMDDLKKIGIDPQKHANYIIKPYLDHMEWAYAVADLIVYRAGATGIAEITAKGIPAILIPYPYAAGNHQEYNARSLEKSGAALVINDRDLDGEILTGKINLLFNDEEKLKKMAKESAKMGIKNAQENIVKLIEELVEKR